MPEIYVAGERGLWSFKVVYRSLWFSIFCSMLKPSKRSLNYLLKRAITYLGFNGFGFMTTQTRYKCFVLFVSVILSSSPGLALELGIDGSFSGSTQLDDWGASSHIQLKGSSSYGVDLGYEYLNTINYNALGTSLSHSISQYEASVFWQGGDKAFRIQTLAGAVFSNSWVQSGGSDVITQYAPGYQVGLGISVPIFTRFRAFAEAGYQGWINAEIPAHTTWRYGVRMLFGGQGVQRLEAEEQANALKSQEEQEAMLANPPVTIDPKVPQYVPSHLSQSLPPIVANAEICNCFPAGPYTLQLGEFNNRAQAIRGLEYRGLRQFFNSRTYLNSPLPVFFAQAETDGPVGIYLGELSSIEELQFWRLELRRSGLQARFRKVVGSSGNRVANPIVAIDEKTLALTPKYTAEEIRRMNSLPEDWEEESTDQSFPVKDIVAEKETYEKEQAAHIANMNKVDQDVDEIQSVLQLGPLPMNNVIDLFSTSAMKSILSRDMNMEIPDSMSMVWDETNKEAWLKFTGFSSDQHVDEWLAWFSAEDLSANEVKNPYVPLGDVYGFELGQGLEEYSVEIERQQNMSAMLQRMRSPEVLWFQAYQRINEEPVSTTLNWSNTDKRFHLIVTNVSSAEEQQKIWSNLTAVGLLPSLAEQ
jgi:hypothetical protein